MSGTASPGARRSPAWRHLMPWLAVVLLGAALSATWLLQVHETPPSLPTQPALVVLPLHAAGGGAEQTALAQGLSRDLIARLAHAETLHVIAWPSALRAQAEQLDLQQIGAQLHASYVLQGNLRLADVQRHESDFLMKLSVPFVSSTAHCTSSIFAMLC